MVYSHGINYVERPEPRSERWAVPVRIVTDRCYIWRPARFSLKQLDARVKHGFMCGRLTFTLVPLRNSSELTETGCPKTDSAAMDVDGKRPEDCCVPIHP